MTIGTADTGHRDLTGQVALVTGAAQNIGFGIAQQLAGDGAAIIALDKDAQALEEAVGHLRAYGKVVGVVADVSSRLEVEAALETARANVGEPDILINNAGIWITKSLLQHTDDDWNKVISINLTGTFICCTAVLPGMIRRGKGAIVNISSIAAWYYTIPHASYAASKAGVSALTRDLAYEVAPLGVRVNAIAPGNIPKEPRETKGLPIGSGTPQDIADAVAFLVSDAARYVVGVTLPVAGGGDLALNYGQMEALRDQHLGPQQVGGL
jgi:NAD(P)-dependent dehydrogenase (short-subunit alcohol dehydrogenase family)